MKITKKTILRKKRKNLIFFFEKVVWEKDRQNKNFEKKYDFWVLQRRLNKNRNLKLLFFFKIILLKNEEILIERIKKKKNSQKDERL